MNSPDSVHIYIHFNKHKMIIEYQLDTYHSIPYHEHVIFFVTLCVCGVYLLKGFFYLTIKHKKITYNFRQFIFISLSGHPNLNKLIENLEIWFVLRIVKLGFGFFYFYFLCEMKFNYFCIIMVVMKQDTLVLNCMVHAPKEKSSILIS